jgi:glycosyltransferase involved in cell wall biosynthesis
MKIIHHTSVIDGRQNSGTARIAIEIIRELSSHSKVKQFFLHYDDSQNEIYQIPKIHDLKLKKMWKRSLTFYWFCFSSRFKCLKNNQKYQYDISHWHVFRVYPFFWLLPAKKHIITVHDAGYFLLPYTQTRASKVFMRSIKRNLDRIEFIIVLSKDAKQNLIKFGGFPESKVKVLYPASRFATLTSINPDPKIILKQNDKFIVCVSRWQPHKNIEKLIEGFLQFNLNNPQSTLKLVLVGKPVVDHDAPVRLLSAAPNNSNILVVSDLSDSNLAWLYDHAIFSIFPSLHEGFGLPVLESLSRGCPAIVDKNTATGEIGSSAVLEIDMRNSEEIAEAILKLTTDNNLLNQLRLSSRPRASEFSWDKTVKELLGIYKL